MKLFREESFFSLEYSREVTLVYQVLKSLLINKINQFTITKNKELRD